MCVVGTENSTSASPLRGQQPLSSSRPLPKRPLLSVPITSRLPQRFPTRTQAPTCSHFLSPSDLPPSLATSIPSHGADPGPSHLFFHLLIAAKLSPFLSLSPHFPPRHVLLGAPALRSAFPLPPPPPKKKGYGIFLPAWSRGTFPCLQPPGLIPSCTHPPGRGVPGQGGCSRGWHCGVVPGFGSHRCLHGGPPWGPAHPSTRVVAAPHTQES